MSKTIRNDYLILISALLSLSGGLYFGSQAIELASTLFYGFGALIGLLLSISLLVRAVRDGEFGSDVLALISIVATSFTQEWLAASVITLMLATGRALERWAEGRARNQLESLLSRAPQSAHLISENNEVRDVVLAKVAIGNRILVRSGEVVPIDGTVIGTGVFDESALTGEPIPKFLANGEEVSSGVVNAGSQVELVTTHTSEDSTYSGLVRLVKQAQANSAAGVRVANKWAVRFVPFAILLAAGTWIITGNYSNAVAVIVAATPCPLILAVPVAIIAGMSKAASHGAIIKGGAALEQLARAETVLLDKTGTLTQGGPEISTIAFAPTVDRNEVLRLAASLEQSSPHVVAKALVDEGKKHSLMLERAIDVVEEHGTGLSGLVAGRKVKVSQPDEPLPEWAQLSNALLVAIKIDGQLAAVAGLDDPLRDEAKVTIDLIRELGVKRVAMISGDRRSTAEEIGALVGVDEVFAECKPEDKLKIVADEMRTSKGSVVAVGDGINDAPALAAATVGVAMGARGATAASEAADVVIIEDSIKHLATAVQVAKGSRARALQAAGVGMALAVVAMFGGALGVLNATESAIAQEFIDVTAILWALVPVRVTKSIN
ncbi:MAG: heavy metal translocating P-type ATPase [Rhodoluna sp.]